MSRSLASRSPASRAPLGRAALELRRRPRLRRALVVAVALLVGLLVQRTVAGAEAARAAWGPSRTVLVATRDLPPGHVLEAGDVEPVRRPTASLPPGAVDQAAGRTVRSLVLEGEVLVRDRLTLAGASGVAALLPPGGRAVAVPVEPATSPPLLVGQLVDVLGTAADADGSIRSVVLAAGVPIVAVREHAATVALAEDEVPRVVTALAAGAVTLAVTG